MSNSSKQRAKDGSIGLEHHASPYRYLSSLVAFPATLNPSVTDSSPLSAHFRSMPTAAGRPAFRSCLYRWLTTIHSGFWLQSSDHDYVGNATARRGVSCCFHLPGSLVLQKHNVAGVQPRFLYRCHCRSKWLVNSGGGGRRRLLKAVGSAVDEE